ncbi:hypothetical protein GW813_05605, partial [bacterium]|nr:hypothetical protein [bacterium]
MRSLVFALLTAVLLLPQFADAQDLREAYRKAEQMKAQEAERAQAKEEAIKADRESFLALVSGLEQRQEQM